MTRNLAVLERGNFGQTEFGGAPWDLGDEIEDVADGLVLSDLTSQTHEGNLNSPNGLVSILERFRVGAQTRIGRLSVLIALSGPAITLAGCESGAPVTPEILPSATAGANGMGGGDILTNGDVIIITHKECVVTTETADAYADLSASAQEACQKEFAALPADKVRSLSPLGQARWMAYYRKQTLDMPPTMFDVDLKMYENVFTEEASRNGLASVLLLLHDNNIGAMAWYLQQSDGQGTDPRTRWALFGPGTRADSDEMKAAADISRKLKAKNKTLEDYVNSVPRVAHPTYESSGISNIKATKNADGTWDYSFTATRADNGQKRTFNYRYLPFLGDEGTALANGDLREINSNAELLGKNLTALPLPA